MPNVLIICALVLLGSVLIFLAVLGFAITGNGWVLGLTVVGALGLAAILSSRRPMA